MIRVSKFRVMRGAGLRPSSTSSSLHRKPLTVHYPVCIAGGGPVGLWLSMLLTDMGVNHCVVEKRLGPTNHPQAHYINTRTMEIFQSHANKVFQGVIKSMPPSDHWRDFSYCYSVIGREFARVDHFSPTITNPEYFEMSPTACVHLPQNILESIMRDEIKKTSAKQIGTMYFGYEASQFVLPDAASNTGKGIQLVAKKVSPTRASSVGGGSINSAFSEGESEVHLSTDLLIGADGAHSKVRKLCGINLIGQQDIQVLLNVQFCCPGLKNFLAPRPAMLYFVFNETAVAVFVAHNVATDEWVCQIPIFPPFQNAKDYSEEQLKKMLRDCLGINHLPDLKNKLRIASTSTWHMDAVVADKYIFDPISKNNSNRNSSNGRLRSKVILVGDAAHRFPPAGGFGMNTGIQDAHNLAWKIAQVVHGNASIDLLNSYEEERQIIAKENINFSLRNYSRSSKVASALGVDPQYAKWIVNTASHVGSGSSSHNTKNKTAAPAAPEQGNFGISTVFNYFTSRLSGAMVNNALNVGLMQLAPLQNKGGILDWRVENVSELARNNETLGLIFPQEDLLFKYNLPYKSEEAVSASDSAIASNTPRTVSGSIGYHELAVGYRIPHSWFGLYTHGYYHSALGLVNDEFTLAVSFSNKVMDVVQKAKQFMHDEQLQRSYQNILKQYVDYLKYLIKLDMQVINSLKFKMNSEPFPDIHRVKPLIREIIVKCELIINKLAIVTDEDARTVLKENITTCIKNLTDMMVHVPPLVVLDSTPHNRENKVSIGSILSGSAVSKADNLESLAFTVSSTYLAAIVPMIMSSDQRNMSRQKLSTSRATTTATNESISSSNSESNPLLSLSASAVAASASVAAMSKKVSHRTPMFVLIVPAAVLHLWNNAISTSGLSSVTVVVGVCEDYRGKTVSSETEVIVPTDPDGHPTNSTTTASSMLLDDDGTNASHRSVSAQEIQQLLQVPKLINNSNQSQGSDVQASCLLKHYDLFESLRLRKGNTFIEGLVNQNLIHMKDIGGKWKKICEAYAEKHSRNVAFSSSKLAVLIRPDGHVVSIANAIAGKADMDLFVSEYKRQFSLHSN